MKNILQTVVATSILVGMVACGDPQGSIPSPYQGVFQGNGAQLDTIETTAQLQIGGRTLKSNVSPLTYEVLYKGQSGFYNELATDNSGVMTVYWVTPNPNSMQDNAQAQIRYYTADIVYMQMNINQKDAVGAIHIVHSPEGTVELDTSPLAAPNADITKVGNQYWQLGWPNGADDYSLDRTAAKSTITKL